MPAVLTSRPQAGLSFLAPEPEDLEDLYSRYKVWSLHTENFLILDAFWVPPLMYSTLLFFANQIFLKKKKKRKTSISI